MAPFAADRYGNASGSHRLARQARTALEEARDVVAEQLGAAPGDVIFTSGGTEADNLAVLGTLATLERSAAAPDGPATEPAVVVTSAVEHAAVLVPARAAAGRRWPPVRHREAPVDAAGAVDLARLADVLGPDVVLVSVMLANNEVGTVQPFDDVVALVRQAAPRAVVHTDAVQAAPWLDVATAAAAADLVSVSAHKVGGPKGAGALVARAGVSLAPLLHGGGQERDRRSGTHDVAGAVGLATALAVVADQRVEASARVAALRDRLVDGLLAAVPGTVESAPRTASCPATATSVSTGSTRKSCSSCSTTRASARRPGRPVPAARSSRAMSCWPWASHRPRPGPASGSRSATRRPRPTSTGPWPPSRRRSPASGTDGAPGRRTGALGWRRGRAKRTDRPGKLAESESCVCSWLCPAGSTPRSRPRCSSRPATTSSGRRSSCGAARRTPAAARWPTSTTPAGWLSSSASPTTSST